MGPQAAHIVCMSTIYSVPASCEKIFMTKMTIYANVWSYNDQQQQRTNDEKCVTIEW